MNDFGNMERSMYCWQEQKTWAPHRKIYRKETPSSIFKTSGTWHNHRIKYCCDQPFKHLLHLVVASLGSRYCGSRIFTIGMRAGFTVCLLSAIGTLTEQEWSPETHSGEPVGTAGPHSREPIGAAGPFKPIGPLCQIQEFPLGVCVWWGIYTYVYVYEDVHTYAILCGG